MWHTVEGGDAPHVLLLPARALTQACAREVPVTRQPVRAVIERSGDDSKIDRDSRACRQVGRRKVHAASAVEADELCWCGHERVEVFASRLALHHQRPPLVRWRRERQPKVERAGLQSIHAVNVRSNRRKLRGLLDADGRVGGVEEPMLSRERQPHVRRHHLANQRVVQIEQGGARRRAQIREGREQQGLLSHCLCVLGGARAESGAQCAMKPLEWLHALVEAEGYAERAAQPVVSLGANVHSALGGEAGVGEERVGRAMVDEPIPLLPRLLQLHRELGLRCVGAARHGRSADGHHF